MDIKKVEELIRMKNNCSVAIETLNTELLGNIANGIARLVALEEDKISGQMSMDLRPQPTPEPEPEPEPQPQPTPEPEPTPEVKETVVEKVKPVKKVIKIDKPVEVKVEPDVEVEKLETVPVAEKILPTKEEVMKELVAFIQSNGEPALATILESIGGYKTFPAVPQEKYEELLNEIN
jgi:outer membrane biosynthesis protein TonB